MEGRLGVGGTEIVFEVSGAGPRVVWCHGIASCRADDRARLDALAERFTVLAYDARGHGDSAPVCDPALHGYRYLADDLVALLDHVGWKRAALAGISMGAATAARVAASHPHRASALVMLRPGAAAEDGAAPPWLRWLFASGASALRAGGVEAGVAFLRDLPVAREYFAANPGALDSFRRSWSRHDPASLAAALEAIPASIAMEDLSPGAIACPVLVVPGDDLIHPREAAEAIGVAVPHAVIADAPVDAAERWLADAIAALDLGEAS